MSEYDSSLLVGTAGWSIPKFLAAEFPAEGPHLVRYSRALNCVEINSSFYREHQRKTYERWAASTPENFHFTVKLLKVFTHEQKLRVDPVALQESLMRIAGLERKWAALLVQLPPSLAFHLETAREFFGLLQRLCPAPVALEPRHESWNTEPAKALLGLHGVSRVFADPECIANPTRQELKNSPLVYYRLHGSPEVYRSLYEEDQLTPWMEDLAWLKGASPGHPRICIFDNTTFGFATKNALEVERLAQHRL